MINNILIKPIITEKSIGRTREKYFTFEVVKKSTKHQMKEAIERLFPVTVVSIKTISRLGKTKRSGRLKTESKKSDRRYALVKLEKDQSIDLFSVAPEQTK